MTDIQTIACPKCGGNATRSLRGHWDEGNCRACGWHFSGTICYVDDFPMDPYPRYVSVGIEWASQDVRKELIRARELFPELRDIPLPELLKRAKASRTFNVGTYPLSWAFGVRERAKAEGISVMFVEDVEESPDPR